MHEYPVQDIALIPRTATSGAMHTCSRTSLFCTEDQQELLVAAVMCAATLPLDLSMLTRKKRLLQVSKTGFERQDGKTGQRAATTWARQGCHTPSVELEFFFDIATDELCLDSLYFHFFLNASPEETPLQWSGVCVVRFFCDWFDAVTAASLSLLFTVFHVFFFFATGAEGPALARSVACLVVFAFSASQASISRCQTLSCSTALARGAPVA